MGENPLDAKMKSHPTTGYFVQTLQAYLPLRNVASRRERIVRAIENVAAVCGDGNPSTQDTMVTNGPRKDDESHAEGDEGESAKGRENFARADKIVNEQDECEEKK
jgi:hypothetical protein